MKPACAKPKGGRVKPTRPVIKSIGETDYGGCMRKMRDVTLARDSNSLDEIWLTTHPPVYTLGQSGKKGHLLRDNGIPVAQSDRGGQITYHGPGQAIAYVLFDLVRAGIGIRTLVNTLEQATINFLASHNIAGKRAKGMPGVYVAGSKIAALGLRIRKGRSYHGISLNVDLDLAPFDDIDTCGYKNLDDTSMKALGVEITCDEAIVAWGESIAEALLESRFHNA